MMLILGLPKGLDPHLGWDSWTCSHPSGLATHPNPVESLPWCLLRLFGELNPLAQSMPESRVRL